MWAPFASQATQFLKIRSHRHSRPHWQYTPHLRSAVTTVERELHHMNIPRQSRRSTKWVPLATRTTRFLKFAFGWVTELTNLRSVDTTLGRDLQELSMWGDLGRFRRQQGAGVGAGGTIPTLRSTCGSLAFMFLFCSPAALAGVWSVSSSFSLPRIVLYFPFIRSRLFPDLSDRSHA